MATEKWTAMTAVNDIVPTQADALANGSSSDPGTEVDNATNKNRFGILEFLDTFGSNPTALSSIDIYAVVEPNGSNYSDGNSTRAPSPTLWLGSFIVQATTAAQRVVSRRVELPPCKFKIVLKNRCGVATVAPTVNLYTFNRDIG